MRSHTTLPAVAAVAALLLSGCAGTGSQDPDSEQDAGAVVTAGSIHPVTVENCGTTVELEDPPERILTVKSTSTELVLALGMGDRLIGTAFSDGPLPEALEAEAADVPEVSEGVPGQEALLELGPDFVFAGWESVFTADGAGDRDSLADFGVATYVAPAACQGENRPPALTFEQVFDDIREAGALLGVPDAAEGLVGDQEELLEGVEAVEGEPTALWYSSGTDTPYVGAGAGAPQMMLERAGFRNIAADVDETWSSLSWEVIAEEDPDVIVLIDADWNTAESKIERLESSPVTSQLSAVRDGRYLRVPFAAGEAGVRNAEAVASLVEQYADLTD